jgi:hypothetical protein
VGDRIEEAVRGTMKNSRSLHITLGSLLVSMPAACGPIAPDPGSTMSTTDTLPPASTTDISTTNKPTTAAEATTDKPTTAAEATTD